MSSQTSLTNVHAGDAPEHHTSPYHLIAGGLRERRGSSTHGALSGTGLSPLTGLSPAVRVVARDNPLFDDDDTAGASQPAVPVTGTSSAIERADGTAPTSTSDQASKHPSSVLPDSSASSGVNTRLQKTRQLLFADSPITLPEPVHDLSGKSLGYSGSITPGAPSVQVATAPTTPAWVTPSQTRTGSPVNSQPLITSMKPDRYKLRLLAACFAFFVCGWADGSTGTLIPHYEEYYQLSHLAVSMIFVAGAVGFLVGTALNEPLYINLGYFSTGNTHRRFIPYISFLHKSSSSDDAVIGHSTSQGRFWTLVVGCCGHLITFAIGSSRPPFAGLAVAHFFAGFTIALLTGQLNAYVAGAALRTQGRALGSLHGCYGLGAFASPLISQSVLAAGWQWNQFFYLSLAVAVLDITFVAMMFHTTRTEFAAEQEQVLEAHTIEMHLEQVGNSASPVSEMVRTPSKDGSALESAPAHRATRKRISPQSTMRQALSHRYVWIFMAFLCFYTGSETTVGGWIVTYLLRERNADPNTVGYVATGFWGGLGAGRFILGSASPYIGLRREKHLVHVYIAICMAMTIMIWFIPSFVGNALFASSVGFFLGPIFPTSCSLATKLLPHEIHMTALAVMSSLASVGSAIFPFVAGALANAKGVSSLQPFTIGILGAMAALWCLLPARVGGMA